MKNNPFIVGISGASGSGKTSVLNKLFAQFAPEEICLISQDNYYKPLENQEIDTRGIVNFDLPSAFDTERYLSDILKLQAGEAIQKKEYTFNNADKTPQTIVLNPAPIIIIEGLFVFHFDKFSNLFDLKVFVDVEDHIRLKRRIIRDNEERGYDLQDVLYRYEYHVFPAYQKYIAPYRYEADIIIPNNHNFEKGLEVLVAFLKNKL